MSDHETDHNPYAVTLQRPAPLSSRRAATAARHAGITKREQWVFDETRVRSAEIEGVTSLAETGLACVTHLGIFGAECFAHGARELQTRQRRAGLDTRARAFSDRFTELQMDQLAQHILDTTNIGARGVQSVLQANLTPPDMSPGWFDRLLGRT